MSHHRDFAPGEAASNEVGQRLDLAASVFLPILGRNVALIAQQPAGSVTPFVTIDSDRLVRIGKIERF